MHVGHHGFSPSGVHSELDHAFHDITATLGREFVSVQDRVHLSCSGLRVWKTLQLGHVIVVELRIEPHGVGDFGEAVDPPGELPVDQGFGPPVGADDIPRGGVAMAENQVTVVTDPVQPDVLSLRTGVWRERLGGLVQALE